MKTGVELTAEEKQFKFEKEDIVAWTYKHWVNSKSYTFITKTGVFVREIKRKKKFLSDWDANPIALVLFKGNKKASKVYVSELKRL